MLTVDKPQGFSVHVDDNFNSFAEYSSGAADERSSEGADQFVTYEDPLVEAQEIVD